MQPAAGSVKFMYGWETEKPATGDGEEERQAGATAQRSALKLSPARHGRLLPRPAHYAHPSGPPRSQLLLSVATPSAQAPPPPSTPPCLFSSINNSLGRHSARIQRNVCSYSSSLPSSRLLTARPPRQFIKIQEPLSMSCTASSSATAFAPHPVCSSTFRGPRSRSMLRSFSASARDWPQPRPSLAR